jgi:hypothetical protein
MTATICLPVTEVISIDAMASVDTVVWRCRLCDHHSTATTRPTAHSEGDDEDQISRLRVTGRGRLYGFRRDERFYALWWDPEHAIYPSPKKHT